MNKAILIIILIVVIAAIVGAFIAGSSPLTIDNASPVTAYIDDVAYNTNLTEPRTIDWGAVQPGNTYTRNFTVANNQNQPLNLQLLTTEPAGNSQSWPYNNTQIQPLESLKGTLSLTLDTVAASGVYTWRLFAINGTMPNPTPSPTPSTPPVSTYQFTVESGVGVQNITFAINNALPYTVEQGSFPVTFLCKSTDTITFKANNATGYIFNGWLIDGMTPETRNPYVKSDITGNFTVKATFS
jgi:uncharacterized repeat protein (TIGR02543 family)